MSLSIHRPLSTLALSALAAGSGLAQNGDPDDYNFNFVSMSARTSILTTGPLLFGAVSGNPHFAGPGDSIRTCYGIDSFQGGRNESTGKINITHLSWVQSASFSSVTPQIGLSSVLAQSVDSLDGDACLSALFAQGVDSFSGQPITLRSVVGASFVPFPLLPLPGLSQTSVLEVADPSGVGIELPSTLGQDANGFPLLPHVIFEVQGPANAGPDNNQYFVASTSEQIGLGSGGMGTGGVTNGNGRMGSSVFGLTADQTGAISHNRLTAVGPGGVIFGATTATFSGPEKDFWSGYSLASQTPVGWAVNDGFAGGGGPDWRISSAPVSTLDLTMLDVRAGGEGDGLFAAQSGVPALGSSIDNPGLAFNAAVFLWGTEPATLMLQQPMSWDTASGQAVPGTPASGGFFTSRAGVQRLPLGADPLTQVFLECPPFTVGTTFRSAIDPADGSSASLFELGEGLDIDGQSRLLAAMPVTSSPKPGLAGTRLGIAAVGVQLNPSGGLLNLTEFASACTVVLQ